MLVLDCGRIFKNQTNTDIMRRVRPLPHNYPFCSLFECLCHSVVVGKQDLLGTGMEMFMQNCVCLLGIHLLLLPVICLMIWQ